MTASTSGFRRWSEYREYDEQEMIRRAAEFRADIQRRRTIRDFSDRPVPRQVIEDCIAAAATAPSGANMQPWRFVAVADPAIKHRIRIAAEDEERHFYEHRASEEWLDALAPLGTDADKPFLEIAPWLIAVFEERWGLTDGGERRKHYYPTESVGIATGFLIAALHNAGLATLTHTPSPMKFLNEILGRSRNERPFLLLVTGYPSDDVQVPDINRKPLREVADFKTDGG
ncbi:MAG: nitroreductase family protein [Gammaproteobacteria bacterium]|nr:MAG: nitroreductase family protein [Gammaproteobacteria bacterium]